MSAAEWEGPLLAAAILLLSGCGGLGWAAGQSQAGQRLAEAARWCAGSGGYLLLLVLVVRGLQAQDWPLASTYEAVLLTAAAMALFCALGTGHSSPSGAFLAGLGAAVMVIVALLAIPAGARAPRPTPALLRGLWFPLHVIATTLGYGGLIVAGLAGLGRLLARPQAQGKKRRPPLRAEELDGLARRGLAWGYPWLTAGMLLGAVWGWQTWGAYWSWSVKEVLTLLTWGLFTLALHVRRIPGWRGRPYAAVLLAGLVALLLTLGGADWIARQMGTGIRYLF